MPIEPLTWISPLVFPVHDHEHGCGLVTAKYSWPEIGTFLIEVCGAGYARYGEITRSLAVEGGTIEGRTWVIFVLSSSSFLVWV